MTLVLDSVVMGMVWNGREDDGTDADHPSESTSWWSFAVRLGLGVAALCAAYFIMTDPWPAAIAAKAFITVPTGSVPASMGSLFASLR